MMRVIQLSKRKRNQSIVEMEKRLDELVATDIYNEEIYTILKSMAYIYIHQNKYTTGYNGIEDVCHDVASDVWLSVIDGRKIKAWMFYIGKMIKISYIQNQKDIEHEVVDVSDDPVLKETMKYMNAGYSISCQKDFDDMERNLMLDGIPGMIHETMMHIKYRPNTPEWNQIYCNVCLNLYRELNYLEPIWFRIKSNLKPYVSIVMEQFKREFRDSGFTESINDNVDEDLEFQLIANENAMKSIKEAK